MVTVTDVATENVEPTVAVRAEVFLYEQPRKWVPLVPLALDAC